MLVIRVLGARVMNEVAFVQSKFYPYVIWKLKCSFEITPVCCASVPLLWKKKRVPNDVAITDEKRTTRVINESFYKSLVPSCVLL